MSPSLIFYEPEWPFFTRFVEMGAEKNGTFFSAPISTNLGVIPLGCGGEEFDHLLKS
jgi:hypothetical protein